MRVMVVDGHRMFSEALRFALAEDIRIDSCEVAERVEDALALLGDGRWDVIVVDENLVAEDGITALVRIRGATPDARVVLVTGVPDVELLAAAEAAGVDAFVSREAPLSDLGDAVVDDEIQDHGSAALLAALAEEIRRREARSNAVPVDLTPRERDVLVLLSQGVLVKDIARRLGITTETCRGYIKSLLMKLDARSQLQAVVLASRMGLLGDDGLEEPTF